MDGIKVTIPSKEEHNAQVVTGFLMLKEKGLNVEIVDDSNNSANPFFGMPVIQAEYLGRRIIYDHWDGYQYPESIKKCLDWADVYFKRSFSHEKNARFFPDDVNKLYPLGFNYHVTHKNSPLVEPFWKLIIKRMLGKEPESYFQPEVFECEPYAISGSPRIIFFTRLWDSKESTLSEALQQERALINETRIKIIRSLKQRYGAAFIGGLNDSPLSRKMAPDLIMPRKYTDRKNYLNQLRACDICIGSMGLHESIGWKTAEYVAAAKAIVNETFHYSVPGDFLPEKNYLPYETVEECLAAVHRLMDDPGMLLEMKRANHKYYQEYLRPDVLVSNSLDIVRDLAK